MKDNNKEPKLTYALDASGKMVYIGTVKRGISCNCYCPKCKESLVAKLGHEGGRQAHFAHQKSSNCHGSYMTALHKLAEQIIEEEKAVMAPAYKEINKQKLLFEHVEVEQRVERKDLQPDLVGVSFNGLRWFIEIRNTHEIDEAKRAKLIESNITCLEIDVREQFLDNLKSFLLESTESREWVNNPNYESQIVEEKRKKVFQIEKFLLESHELTIPIYDDTDTQIICFKEVCVLSKSDDGLFVRVKAISSEDIPYVFEIGSYDILKVVPVSLEHECNVLTIYIDNLLHEAVVSPEALDIEWSYHYVTEKEREAKIREFKDNPQYEVRPFADCYSQCKYRPVHGKCIYLETFVSQHGIDYVVCNKGKRQKEEQTTSSRSQISSNVGSQHTDNEYQKEDISEKNYTEVSQSKLLPNSLPFDRYWTIDDYFQQLQSSCFYETEKGLSAKIVKLDMTNNGILLLYKEPNEASTFWPFRIAIISTNNGVLVRNNVADFTSKTTAMDSYYKRLGVMGGDKYLRRNAEVDNDELPF